MEPRQEPGAGTHGASRRRGLLCSAYPWGGRGVGAARPPPPCRLSNSTSGLEEKRKGRWGRESERAPGCWGASEGGGAPRCAPRRDSSGPAGVCNRSGCNLPPLGHAAGQSAKQPPGDGLDQGALGAHGSRASCGQSGGRIGKTAHSALLEPGRPRGSEPRELRAGAARGRQEGSRAAPSAGELAKLAEK